VHVRLPLLAASAALAGVLAAACGPSDGAKRPDTVASNAVGASATAAAPAACTGTNAELTLPAGFCATVFADSIVHARHAVAASNGDVYVTLEGTRPSAEKEISGADKGAPPPASFVALRDTNRDGRADIIRRIGSLGNTGIAIANGYLYVDEGKQIVRYARADSALAPAGAREVVVSGIPMDGGHRARNIAIGDSSLYINVGSTA
jgi:glucose/arabinose dehydrogenase